MAPFPEDVPVLEDSVGGREESKHDRTPGSSTPAARRNRSIPILVPIPILVLVPVPRGVESREQGKECAQGE
jgi:hypothetical protein